MLADPVLRLNLVMSLAIVLVLLLRRPARARIGASAAYALWLLVPLACLATLLPPRVVDLVVEAQPTIVWQGGVVAPAPSAEPFDLRGLLLGLWAAGVAASLALLTWRHLRFVARLGRQTAVGSDRRLRRVARAGVGPAIYGLISPRIVLPADFEDRYSPEEREVVLAHERVHLRRGDSRINVLAALAQCLCWFNPLAHIAVRCLRIDQELACDEAVVAWRPEARRIYAEVLLKSQLADIDLPLGCYWPARSANPLKMRLELLIKSSRTRTVSRFAHPLIAVLAVGSGAVAWAAQPARVEVRQQTAVRQGPAYAAEPPVVAALPIAVAQPPAPTQTPPPSSSMIEQAVTAGDCARVARLEGSGDQQARCEAIHASMPPRSAVQFAEAAGDCARLLRLENAAAVVRCEQANGRYLDVDPERPNLVSQSFSGMPPYPVRPLPPLPEGAETRSLQGGGTDQVAPRTAPSGQGVTPILNLRSNSLRAQDPAVRTATNEVLGLPLDTVSRILCTSEDPPGTAQLAWKCFAHLTDGGRVEVPPETMARLQELRLLPSGTPPPVQAKPPGEVISTSPLTNSVVRD